LEQRKRKRKDRPCEKLLKKETNSKGGICKIFDSDQKKMGREEGSRERGRREENSAIGRTGAQGREEPLHYLQWGRYALPPSGLTKKKGREYAQLARAGMKPGTKWVIDGGVWRG